MIFALRGAAVSLALFLLSYWLIAVLVTVGWQFLARSRHLALRTHSELLFAIRILPLALASLLTIFLALPSFILREPRATPEETGLAVTLLAAGSLAFLLVGSVRALRAHAQTRRILAHWMSNARPVNVGASAPTFEVPGVVAPMTLAGISNPQLIICQSALAELSANELASAVRHEMAHLRSRDNLKKFLLRFAWFPGATGLEKSWREAAELAADDAAAHTPEEALDLATALIKLSRRRPAVPMPEISMGLLDDSLVATRVERLVNWSAPRPYRPAKTAWALVSIAAALAALIVMNYGVLLSGTHAFTEWLVR